MVDEGHPQVGDATGGSKARWSIRVPAPLAAPARRDPFEEIGEASRVPAGIVEAPPVEMVRPSQKCIRRRSDGPDGLGIRRKRLS